MVLAKDYQNLPAYIPFAEKCLITARKTKGRLFSLPFLHLAMRK
ncbi:hypothetical protein F543_21100 [Bibersteinia trehalosi USDA-ARS-USMARC-189]|uniref:Uncharacterized protein n=2 Tax=Bibersteinia trehalosi TaxID=47735 RepID=W0R3Y4_BIBTR|nr:hypothetical protein WQG_2740 [Bibersteinia trehalosi USDA-ARS-USMARC-192]AHG84968.1 hypothetical protein F543_21100 [Bibersteinia trehalosi USDA-ARS-USMARC-189]AHG85456.1 hypothetical protein F544_2220 [Bibersteinia trehalosi USDA-ARS-USMARC-190]